MRKESNCIYKRQGDRRRNRSHVTLPPFSSAAPAAHVSNVAQNQENGSPSSFSQLTADSHNSNITITRNPEAACPTPCSTFTSVSTHPIGVSSTVSALSEADADAMTGIVRDSSISMEFFGSSSAVSFMRQINTAIDARLGSSQPMHHSTSRLESLQREDRKSEDQDHKFNMVAYTLPPRRFADVLLQSYYDLVWVILPIHDWTIFRVAYSSVWTGSDTTIPERELYSMINVAFALGSQFSNDIEPNRRRETGQTFWTRARTLFNPFLHYEASLERVQCLLMMGLFLQSTCQSHQCWMTIGSAIRMAQSLGLHLSSSSRPGQTFREAEIARRVWHGCVFMDRWVDNRINSTTNSQRKVDKLHGNELTNIFTQSTVDDIWTT